ncbi:DUF7344 domain-containing protein [Halosimplex salinum]|uniref:DUF7344 domain-containing protein n=1 Tax=Halosimplex salinum TaxID=1710538 RepID=UPI001F48694A|nr:hypothetical protein [Halosimplex salinum]
MNSTDDGGRGVERARAFADGGETVRDDRAALPESVVADLRASERRCHALECLDSRDDPLPVSDLARAVAARERDEPRAEIPDDVVDTVRRDLFQRHLPKLTATEVVRYDSQVGTVALSTDDGRLLGGVAAGPD